MGLANDYLKQADELRRGHVIQAAFPKKAPSIAMSADPPKADILRCGWAVLAFENYFREAFLSGPILRSCAGTFLAGPELPLTRRQI